MTIINLYTRGLELYASERPKVAAGNEGTVKINVTFDSTWAGYAKSAVFKTNSSPIEYEVALVSNGCFVPKEVLVDEGHIFIGVRGTNGQIVNQSMRLRYKIEKGSNGVLVFDPSPDVYRQIMTAIGVLEGRMDAFAALDDSISLLGR